MVRYNQSRAQVPHALSLALFVMSIILIRVCECRGVATGKLYVWGVSGQTVYWEPQEVPSLQGKEPIDIVFGPEHTLVLSEVLSGRVRRAGACILAMRAVAVTHARIRVV